MDEDEDDDIDEEDEEEDDEDGEDEEVATSAQAFAKKNAGKLFLYGVEVVRVVGWSPAYSDLVVIALTGFGNPVNTEQKSTFYAESLDQWFVRPADLAPVSRSGARDKLLSRFIGTEVWSSYHPLTDGLKAGYLDTLLVQVEDPQTGVVSMHQLAKMTLDGSPNGSFYLTHPQHKDAQGNEWRWHVNPEHIIARHGTAAVESYIVKHPDRFKKGDPTAIPLTGRAFAEANAGKWFWSTEHPGVTDREYGRVVGYSKEEADQIVMDFPGSDGWKASDASGIKWVVPEAPNKSLRLWSVTVDSLIQEPTLVDKEPEVNQAASNQEESMANEGGNDLKLTADRFAKKYVDRLVGHTEPPKGELLSDKDGVKYAVAGVVGWLDEYLVISFLGGKGEAVAKFGKRIQYTSDTRPERVWVTALDKLVMLDEEAPTTEGQSTTISTGGSKMSDNGGTKGPKKFKNVDVTYAADEQIILPEGMSYSQAREWLTKKEQELEKAVALHYEFDGYPMDAALAFYKAMQKVYGFTAMVPTPGFWGDTPPAMIGVEVSTTETVQVPWGSMKISGIDGMLTTNFGKKDGNFCLTLNGEIRQKHKGKVEDLVKLAKVILKEESIYKGKAIRVAFPQDDEEPSPLTAPKFMDLSRVNRDELVFSDAVQNQIETTVWTPIRKADICRQHQIPLRRGTLLAGKFGTGKTLVASVTAQICEEEGWTFIYLANVKDLPQAILFAKMYAPCVVFAEDINRVVTKERDAEVDHIFNTLDGVDTKHSEVMVVFTTNEIDEINPGLMRPGRIDTIIPVTAPDGPAAQKLMRIYGRGLIAENEDLTTAGELLAGKIPAVVREVVEKSKLAAARHLRPGEPMEVFAKDLEEAAAGMVEHYKYIDPEVVEEPTDIETLGRILGESLKEGVVEAFDEAGRPKKASRNGKSENRQGV